MLTLDTNIQFLKGVGEKRATLYKKLGIETVRDLLYHFPRSYIDLSTPYSIATAPYEEPAAVRARVVHKSGEQRIRKGMSLFKVTVTDDESDMTITFFNQKFLMDALKVDTEYLFYGKVGGSLLKREMASPMVLRLDEGDGLMPVYPQTAGLTSRVIGQAAKQALEKLSDDLAEPLPTNLREQHQLCHLRYALETIHFPSSFAEMEHAKKRLIFEELFTLALALTRVKSRKTQVDGRRYATQDLTPFLGALPYTLTGAQLRSIEEIESDLASGKPMNRLVQGDVGSGKTVVAAAAIYQIVKGGSQAAMMAPTEILAEQHCETLGQMLEPHGIRVGLLTGSMKVSQKNQVKKAITAGELDVVVGTHALISQGIDFRDLGLVITDEQHRFGVNQRTMLSQKGEEPHTLVMSATPIPRTLSLIIYGDLDVSVIDEMPVGRQPIKTWRIDSEKRQRAFGFIKDHLDRGLQAYIICPLVEAGEVDMGLVPATEYAEEIADTSFRDYRVGLLHGKMKAADKEQVMQQFKSGEIQLLVSTTVVEVGVDVPNAVVMLIENAERFGMSQLHQLRGRVGRGNVQSHCILLSDSKGEDAQLRLKTLCRTTSGFEIAEQDLSMRGPGDFFGSRQHGLPQLHIADMTQDTRLLREAQDAARELLTLDPDLGKPEHALIKAQVDHMLHGIGERPN